MPVPHHLKLNPAQDIVRCEIGAVKPQHEPKNDGNENDSHPVHCLGNFHLFLALLVLLFLVIFYCCFRILKVLELGEFPDSIL